MTNRKVIRQVESALTLGRWLVESAPEWYVPLSAKWDRDVVPGWRDQQSQLTGLIEFIPNIKFQTGKVRINRQGWPVASIR